MTGYYRRFVCNYPTIAEPLTNLTKKKEAEKVEWSSDAEPPFQSLKKSLTTSTAVQNPNFTKTFIVQTDASKLGIGFILSQGEDECIAPYIS